MNAEFSRRMAKVVNSPYFTDLGKIMELIALRQELFKAQQESDLSSDAMQTVIEAEKVIPSGIQSERLSLIAVEYIPHPKSSPDEVMVWVDPQKLDAAWKGDESYYLPPEWAGVGVSEIRGRREGFRRFMEKGEAIQAPRASLGEGGRVEIDDGRHRFAVLRDSGANVVPIMVPRKEAQEFRRRFGAGLPILPPPDVPDAPIAASSSGEPLITFPATEAAARDLLERQVMTKAEFEVLADDAKRAAFTVARVSSLDALEKIRDAVASSVSEGSTLRDFRAKVDEALGASALAPHHVEQVFRDNTGAAYTAGLMDVLRDPVVSDAGFYLAYYAIHDAPRVRPEHLAMETLGIQGTNIYRADDPVILEFLPPWDHG